MVKELSFEKITEGMWNENISWEFCLSEIIPDEKSVSAVFSIPIYQEDNIALTKTHRGWEIPGGHIESGEGFEEALLRETKEEIGVDLIKYNLIGFKKVICREPVPNREGGYYPLIGYMPFYLGKINDKPKKNPGGEEVLEAGLFSYSEMQKKKEKSTSIEVVKKLIDRGVI